MFERRGSLEDPNTPLTASNIIDYIGGGTKTDSGINVSEKTALKVGAVWRAVNLIAGTCGSLPLHAYKQNTLQRAPAQLLQNPHPDMTAFEFWETQFVAMLLWGNSYARKVRREGGQVAELHPIHPGQVRVGRSQGLKVFEVTNDDGSKDAFTNAEILHIPGMGYDGITGVSPIRAARQSLGMALAAEEYGARLFGSGSLMSGVLQVEQRLKSEEDADRLKRRWQQKIAGIGKAHEVAVLDGGAKFQPIGIPPGDAQFIESRRFQISEVARWFGIPPHMLFEVEKSTSWGTGIEQQSIGFVVYTLRPWLKRVEQRVTKEATPYGTYAKYSIEGLLRGDAKARAEFYRTMREIGVLNVDEIRELEDRPPLPDGLGQTYLQPLNMEPLGNEEEDEDDDQDEA